MTARRSDIKVQTGMLIHLPADDPKGVRFLRTSLEVCANGNTLSRLLLEIIGKDPGHLSTLVPFGLDPGRLPEYDRSFSREYPPPANDGAIHPKPWWQMALYVRNYLSRAATNIVVSELLAQTPQKKKMFVDPPGYQSPPWIPVLGREVWHVVWAGTTDLDMIDDSICCAAFCQTNICSSSSRVGAAVEAIEAEDVVMEIASNVSVIFVPAYDDDGLLLWSRTRLDARDFVDTSATGIDPP